MLIPGICACPATSENQHILDGRGRDRMPHRRVVEVKTADPALIQVNPGLGSVGAVNFDRIAAAISVAAQAMAQVEHGGGSTAMQQSKRAMGTSRTMIQKGEPEKDSVRDTSSRQDHGGYTEQRKLPREGSPTEHHCPRSEHDRATGKGCRPSCAGSPPIMAARTASQHRLSYRAPAPMLTATSTSLPPHVGWPKPLLLAPLAMS